MNEYSDFPFDDLLQDALEESKLKRFKLKVAEKKGDLDECRDA
jgi:hypothetical protein